MLLTCPHCETIFRVETTDIKVGGRHVRCSICSHIWQAKRGATNVVTEEVDLIQQIKSRQGTVIMILVAIVLAATLSINRGVISAMAPGLIPVYQSIGLTIEPDLNAVEIGQLSATRRWDTVRVLGQMTNISSWPVHAPYIKITVSDQFSVVLGDKIIQLDDTIIQAGAVAAFTTQVMLDEHVDDDVLTEIIVVPVAGPASD